MSDIGQADPYQYAAECEKTAALNQRENVSLKTELSKLQANLDRQRLNYERLLEKREARLGQEVAEHAETKRQLTELDARYTPLVTENDELRERITELEGERSLANARSGKLSGSAPREYIEKHGLKRRP